MENGKKIIYAVQVSRPANQPDAFGNMSSDQALVRAVEILNKRRHVSGEYDMPPLKESNDILRFISVDVDKAVLSAENFRVIDHAVFADLTINDSPLGKVVQGFIDDGSVEKGQYGFRLRSAYYGKDIVNGVIMNFMPVAVDFISLHREK